MKEKLNLIMEAALNDLKSAFNSSEIENIRVKYLGKKGELTTILRGMGALSSEERPIVGKIANEVRSSIENALEAITKEIKNKEKNEKLNSEIIDISMPVSTTGASVRCQ